MAAALPRLQALCHGCLSADRDLSPIGEFKTIYKSICNVKTVPGMKDVNLCWECTATLKRMQSFHKQVNNAQTILKFYAQRKEKSLPKSLSRLEATRTNHDFISLTEPDELYPDEPKPEIKPLDKIKQELDHEDFENTDFFDANNDFTYLEDIKSEDPTLIIKLKKIKKENKKQVSPKSHIKYVRIKTAEKMCVKERARADYLKDLQELNKCTKGSDCSICNKEFTEDENIETRNYHDERIGPHVCRICHTHYPTLEKLESHVKSHVVYRCLVCGHRSPSMEAAGRHVTQHGEIVKCKLCEFCCRKRYEFFTHYRLAHKEFWCDYCGKKWKSRRALERHIFKNHTATKCIPCGLQFRNYGRLKQHNATTHDVDRSEASFCVKCNIQFQNPVRYRRHLHNATAHANEVHGKVPKKDSVKCLICDNRYARRTYMMNHYRHVHMAKTKHYCCDCDRFFLNRTSLLRHREKHEGREKKKDKLCSVCGRGFHTNRILENHMRTHTGERPFECSVCGARFTQKAALNTHQQRHVRQSQSNSFLISRVTSGD